MNIKRIIRKLKSIPWVLLGKGSVCYSQYGEDIIIIKLFERLGLKNIDYLDIGTNVPIRGNNTYNLYQRGYKGILIEPNPYLFKKIKNKRKNDIVLNIGISSKNDSEAIYYMFEDKYNELNTFSEIDALHNERQGIHIKQKKLIPLKNINEIIQKHFVSCPVFLSIDVEGYDEEILRALDYSIMRPLVICVETAVFNLHGEFTKRNSILNFMKSVGYFIYADTHANTIFCDEKAYKSLLSKPNNDNAN